MPPMCGDGSGLYHKLRNKNKAKGDGANGQKIRRNIQFHKNSGIICRIYADINHN